MKAALLTVSANFQTNARGALMGKKLLVRSAVDKLSIE